VNEGFETRTKSRGFSLFVTKLGPEEFVFFFEVSDRVCRRDGRNDRGRALRTSEFGGRRRGYRVGGGGERGVSVQTRFEFSDSAFQVERVFLLAIS